eukprot:TRINITY_DN13251_c0_g1_i1.p1 TRINITY_DN13251_c0_g1~~TRINITY_DN13251_c0_g1_i1.p1  ORF type:complete len:131 (-),score=25.84 TRINITY_DN13251_c0_g1_i1:76-468(-)
MMQRMSQLRKKCLIFRVSVFEENKDITRDELKEILWEEATLWQNLDKFNAQFLPQDTESLIEEQRQRLNEQQMLGGPSSNGNGLNGAINGNEQLHDSSIGAMDTKMDIAKTPKPVMSDGQSVDHNMEDVV